MARVPSSTKSRSDEAKAPEETPASEASVPEQSTPEQPAPDTSAEDAKTGELVAAFQSAVDEAVAAADRETGNVAVAPLAKVQAAYRELPTGKPKNKARGMLQDGMKDNLASGDVPKARVFMFLGDNLTVAGATGTSKTKAPADPVEAYVEQQVALRLAVATLPVPEGVEMTDEIKTKITEGVEAGKGTIESYRTWLGREAPAEGAEDTPEPEGVTPAVRAAVKLQTGKAVRRSATRSGGSSGGPRGNIGAHIENAFADKEIGDFMTVAEICKVPSEHYGVDNPPSPGAVSARLKTTSGKITVKGVEPAEQDKGNGKTVFGARKVAAPAES